MWKHWCVVLACLLGYSQIVVGQTSLEELQRQLDSILQKREKSEVLIGIGYGNNPAYGAKTADFERPIVMKNFFSPSIAYYHKSGLSGSFSGYYLFNAEQSPWFEWDLSFNYDYTKNRNFLTGISYTRYFFADSSDVPATPIKNELFAYFYYRKWWLQPGISLDLGWGSQTDRVVDYWKIGRKRRPNNGSTETISTISGRDFNVILNLRHPFIFLDVLKFDDALLLTPSAGFILGTAHYYSNMKGFQYISRSPKIKDDIKKSKTHPLDPLGEPASSESAARTGFEPRALDLTLNVSYTIGDVTLSPSFTIFKPLQGEDKSFMSYFTARASYSF
ncbi:hypothetical protein [uncultured Chitinophaga sp.]|jgi:hypothetical protein|uniref:hypothetical protein n=1 Tax=uncultured Chitinophaga sp. TaxID=339340 RepID=UPI00262FCA1D|nr:hypothetical protein [uncultured Chitinophaga sp.]